MQGTLAHSKVLHKDTQERKVFDKDMLMGSKKLVQQGSMELLQAHNMVFDKNCNKNCICYSKQLNLEERLQPILKVRPRLLIVFS